MNSKMTTNSQLSTIESKKKQTKEEEQTGQATRTGEESYDEDHIEGCQQVGCRGENGEKVQGIRSIVGGYRMNWRVLGIV